MTLNDMNVEFIALFPSPQNLPRGFDAGHATTDNHDRGPALASGQSVELLCDTDGIVCITQPQGMFFHALDTGRFPLAAGRDQAGLVWQHQATLGTHHIAVSIDMGYAIVYEFMTIAAN